MAEKTSPPAYRAPRRWLIWFNTIFGVVAVFALVAMANYLASAHFWRLQTSNRGQVDLSKQTTNLLGRITNKIDVTIFYDQHGNEEIYALTSALLKQYNYANPNVSVDSLDYTRSPGRAASFLAKYKLSNLKDKNFVLFDSGGRSKVVYGNQLYDYDLGALIAGQTNAVRRNSFKGEVFFSAAIFNVTYARPSRAYFVYGHGENDPENTSSDLGYAKFAAILKDEANVDWAKLSLSGTNEIPEDCQLLIIAGPSRATFHETELAKIETYLKQGRCLLALLNNLAMGQPSGIEKVLEGWNMGVANYKIEDRQFSPTGDDLIPAQVNGGHAVMKSLVAADLEIYLVLPRTVFPMKAAATDAPQPEALAATSTNAVGFAKVSKENGIAETTEHRGSFPVISAVEYGSIKNVTTQRGVTRILAVGDSLCFDNQNINTKANHEFANSAINWLVDRPQLFLADIGAQPIREYKLLMTPAQTRKLQWILLGAMPGSVLLLGGLVSLRRRS